MFRFFIPRLVNPEINVYAHSYAVKKEENDVNFFTF